MKKNHNDMLAESEAATRARFERQEERRAKDGYGHTHEFAAAARQIIPLLSDHIRGRIKRSLPAALRDIAAEKIALAGLYSLLHNIAATEDGDEDESRHAQHRR
jgi:hypothetical protein